MKRLIMLAIVAAMLTSCVSAGIRAGDNHEMAGMIACLGLACRIIPLPEGTENFLTWGLTEEKVLCLSKLGVVLDRVYQKSILINGVPVGTETYELVIAQSIHFGVPDKISPLVLVHTINTACTGKPVELTRFYIYSDLNLVEVSMSTTQQHVSDYVEKVKGSDV